MLLILIITALYFISTSNVFVNILGFIMLMLLILALIFQAFKNVNKS